MWWERIWGNVTYGLIFSQLWQPCLPRPLLLGCRRRSQRASQRFGGGCAWGEAQRVDTTEWPQNSAPPWGTVRPWGGEGGAPGLGFPGGGGKPLAAGLGMGHGGGMCSSTAAAPAGTGQGPARSSSPEAGRAPLPDPAPRGESQGGSHGAIAAWETGLFLFLESLWIKSSQSQASALPWWTEVLWFILTGLMNLNCSSRASLVAQWLRICLPIQRTRVPALVREDPTCRGATKPVHHYYWVRVTQLLKPACLEPVLRNEKPSATRESPCTATEDATQPINK